MFIPKKDSDGRLSATTQPQESVPK